MADSDTLTNEEIALFRRGTDPTKQPPRLSAPGRELAINHRELAYLQQSIDLNIAYYADALRQAKNRSNQRRISEYAEGINDLRNLRHKFEP